MNVEGGGDHWWMLVGLPHLMTRKAAPFSSHFAGRLLNEFSPLAAEQGYVALLEQTKETKEQKVYRKNVPSTGHIHAAVITLALV